MDMDTKNKLEKLDTMMEQLQLIQEQMKSEQEQRHMEILIALKSLKANGSADSSSAEGEGDQLPIEILETPINLSAVLGNPVIKTQLQSLKRIRVLNQTEWDYLYNSSGPGMHGKSTDFDISLLCKLLRAICSLTPPITGWDNLPNSTDHSLGADLVRIRIYRNTIYGHNHSMEITKADFEKVWRKSVRPY